MPEGIISSISLSDIGHSAFASVLSKLSLPSVRLKLCDLSNFLKFISKLCNLVAKIRKKDGLFRIFLTSLLKRYFHICGLKENLFYNSIIDDDKYF